MAHITFDEVRGHGRARDWTVPGFFGRLYRGAVEARGSQAAARLAAFAAPENGALLTAFGADLTRLRAVRPGSYPL